MEPETLSPFLFLALLLGGCGNENEGPGAALPGGDLLQRLPADSIFALSFPAGTRPGPLALRGLELFGFQPSEIQTLLRSRGFSAARRKDGLIALLWSPARGGGFQGKPFTLGVISRPETRWMDEPALGGTRPWKVLSLAAASWKGDLLCWISLAGILEGKVRSAPEGGGKLLRRGLPGLFLDLIASAGLKEALNLEAFEAALFRVEGERLARCGIFVWPDRVGLPGVLLPERGGLRGKLPPGKQDFLAWRIAPGGLASILVGLESLQGGAGRLIRTGLELFRDRTGLDPARDLVPALEGPLVLSVGPRGGSFMAALRKGPAGERLRRAITSKSKLTEAVKALSGGRLRLFVSGKDLLLQWGEGSGRGSPCFQPDPGSPKVGFFRLPLRLPGGGMEVLFQGEFRRAPYGLEARFEIKK